MNWYMYFVAALIPLAVGSVWYGPLFGKKWMAVNGYIEDDLKGGNMAVIFGLSYIFSVFIAVMLHGLTVHQLGAEQLVAYHPELEKAGSEAANLAALLKGDWASLHRSFGHGVLHGAIAAIGLAFPLIAINSLFERRGWTYIMIHAGYWLVAFMLMGGVLCAFL